MDHVTTDKMPEGGELCDAFADVSVIKAEDCDVPYANSEIEKWYVTVSSKSISKSEFKYDEYQEGAAVCIGELTKLQNNLFQEQFGFEQSESPNRRKYVVGFWHHSALPSNKKWQLWFNVLLRKYKVDYKLLSEVQKEILDSAARLANHIRTADGCGKKNVKVLGDKNRGNKEETDKDVTSDDDGGIYEASVKALIESDATAVAQGLKKKHYTEQEIANELLKSEKFKGTKNYAMSKGIRRTQAWNDRKEIRAKAQREEGLGKPFAERKRDDKHRNRTNMDPYKDVGNN